MEALIQLREMGLGLEVLCVAGAAPLLRGDELLAEQALAALHIGDLLAEGGELRIGGLGIPRLDGGTGFGQFGVFLRGDGGVPQTGGALLVSVAGCATDPAEEACIPRIAGAGRAGTRDQEGQQVEDAEGFHPPRFHERGTAEVAAVS